MGLSRAEFIQYLLMGLIYEEDAVLRDYKQWMSEVEEEEVRSFLSEMVEEAAHHKGEILDIIEAIEAQGRPEVSR